MQIIDALADSVNKILDSTQYCIDDMLDHGMGNWHALVLLDNADHINSLSLEILNDKDFSDRTPLDIAYRLNRTKLIGKLEALGALGDKSLLGIRGVGSFTENNTYVHLPGKQGKLKTLEKRYMEGGSLNSRDEYGNTPLHLIAANGHFKAAKHFSEGHFRFGIDLSAKNNEGNTARNLAVLAGHQDIADQLLIWEIEDYITAARVRHKIIAGLPEMLPNRKASRKS